jgi:hypothetical protein
MATLSSVKRLQAFARLERLDHLIDKQTSRLRLADSMGWPTASLMASLHNLHESRDLFRHSLGLPPIPAEELRRAELRDSPA